MEAWVNIPVDLLYTREHEWIRIEDKTATIGITDYAQGELGDIVFVELPSVDDTIEEAQAFGTIEAVKAVSELFAPLSGKVIEVNNALEDEPMVINQDPYGEGWMIKLEISQPDHVAELLDATAYKGLIAE